MVTVILQMWSTSFNPFTWDKSSQRVTTHVASLEVRDGNGNLIPISGLSPGITISVPLSQPTPNYTIKTSFGKLGVLRQHNISVQYESSMVQILIAPEDSQFTISYIQVTQPTEVSPQETSLECKRTQGEWLHKGNITCKGKTNVTISFIAMYPGKYFLNSEFNTQQTKEDEVEDNQYREPFVRIKEPQTSQIGNANYTFTVSEAACLFWDTVESNWKTTGCKVNKYVSTFVSLCSGIFRVLSGLKQ